MHAMLVLAAMAVIIESSRNLKQLRRRAHEAASVGSVHLSAPPPKAAATHLDAVDHDWLAEELDRASSLTIRCHCCSRGSASRPQRWCVLPRPTNPPSAALPPNRQPCSTLMHTTCISPITRNRVLKPCRRNQAHLKNGCAGTRRPTHSVQKCSCGWQTKVLPNSSTGTSARGIPRMSLI